MTECRLIMVPPGGGEADYSLDFDLPAVPRAGEFITISRGEKYGYECFFIRSVWWELNYPDGPAVSIGDSDARGSMKSIAVECEFARGPHMTEEHKQACNMYERRGKTVRALDDTMY